MAESCSWLFVENVPLLYDKKGIARQLKVETWLDLVQLSKELECEANNRKSTQGVINYVV